VQTFSEAEEVSATLKQWELQDLTWRLKQAGESLVLISKMKSENKQQYINQLKREIEYIQDELNGR